MHSEYADSFILALCFATAKGYVSNTFHRYVAVSDLFGL